MADNDRKRSQAAGGVGGSAVYVLGLIGALVYYIQQADGLWPTVIAVGKGLVWPAFLVYDLLKFLGS